MVCQGSGLVLLCLFSATIADFGYPSPSREACPGHRPVSAVDDPSLAPKEPYCRLRRALRIRSQEQFVGFVASCADGLIRLGANYKASQSIFAARILADIDPTLAYKRDALQLFLVRTTLPERSIQAKKEEKIC